MFTAMRPQILFPLFAEVSTLKGVGPRALPLVQKVAGPLVRDLVFLSPSGVVVRRPMQAADAVDGEVGVFLGAFRLHVHGADDNSRGGPYRAGRRSAARIRPAPCTVR